MSILFEDEHVLAVCKPAGLLTQAAPGRGPTLEDAVRTYLSPPAPRAIYLGTVHRLDRPVSGVIVWAKNPKAARRLSREFETRRASKEYWAVVESTGSTPDEGRWEDWLSPHSNAAGVVTLLGPEDPSARRAVTRWQRGSPRLERAAGLAWLRLWPETGRTHQLRAQCAFHGMPIVGDAAYGATTPFPRPPGIALHARTLSVRHPALGTPLELIAPLPDEWSAWRLADEKGGSVL